MKMKLNTYYFTVFHADAHFHSVIKAESYLEAWSLGMLEYTGSQFWDRDEVIKITISSAKGEVL